MVGFVHSSLPTGVLMRVVLAFIFGFTPVAPAAVPRTEIKAMERVIERVWAEGDSDAAARERMARHLAQDLPEPNTAAHRQLIYGHAMTIAEVIRRHDRARVNGSRLGAEDLKLLITTLVRAHQISGAVRHDQINGATCAAAASVTVAVWLPFCAALPLDGLSFINQKIIDAVLVGSLAVTAATAYVVLIYGLFGRDGDGGGLPTLPGMRALAERWPGNDPLNLFWETLDAELTHVVEWQPQRGSGGEGSSPAEYLEAFVEMLRRLSAPGDLTRSCESLLAGSTATILPLKRVDRT